MIGLKKKMFTSSQEAEENLKVSASGRVKAKLNARVSGIETRRKERGGFYARIWTYAYRAHKKTIKSRLNSWLKRNVK